MIANAKIVSISVKPTVPLSAAPEPSTSMPSTMK
jgi:hypothetical protein